MLRLPSNTRQFCNVTLNFLHYNQIKEYLNNVHIWRFFLCNNKNCLVLLTSLRCHNVIISCNVTLNFLHYNQIKEYLTYVHIWKFFVCNNKNCLVLLTSLRCHNVIIRFSPDTYKFLLWLRKTINALTFTFRHVIVLQI